MDFDRVSEGPHLLGSVDDPAESIVVENTLYRLFAIGICNDLFVSKQTLVSLVHKPVRFK